jgi:hypothetical protein
MSKKFYRKERKGRKDSYPHLRWGRCKFFAFFAAFAVQIIFFAEGGSFELGEL